MTQDSFKNLPETKAAFKEYDKQQKVRLYKLACWFTAIGMPAGISLDMNIYPQDAVYFLKLRLVSSVLALVLFGLFYTPLGLRYYRLLCFTLPLIPQVFISWMIYYTEGSVSPYYAGLSLILLAFCLLLPWTFQETLCLALATTAYYLIACIAHGGFSFHGLFFSNLYFLAMTAIFAVIGTFFTSRLRVREFALRFELDQNKKILEENNRKLVELDQMKSQFFANISHELRTPLTLLIAPLETLQKLKASWMDEETRGTLKIMHSNALRLLKLINDLLDLVKLESGRMEVRKEPVAIDEFIRGLAQSVSATARDKRVALITTIAPEVETVLLDRDKLEKIILNLTFNALKFTHAGGRVELKAEKKDEFLILEVRDTGMGISPQNLPFIFDRFWQADSASNRKYQGTGIGLALVKELTEAQGGSVSVQSESGKGTVMIVKLPYEAAPTGVSTMGAEGKADPNSVLGQELAAEPDEWLAKLYRRAELFPTMTSLADTLRPDSYSLGRKPKLLIADDEPDMLGFLKSQLQKQYEVVEAVDGQQALEKSRQFLPDLILLDMMMPEKDGIEVCRELKNQVSTQGIPIILLTARADDETKMRALESGASDFLSKPFSTTELHVRVKNLVESHHYQRDLAREKNALESTLEQLKETEGQLVQNEKMASLGRLSAGLIHEINNPLNYAAQALYVLRTKKDQLPEAERPFYTEVLDDIEDGVQRVKRIVTDLRTFTHPHMGGGKDLVEVKDVVDTALRFLSHELKDNVKLEVKVPEEQTMLADRNKLIQVFINLIQNASDALREKKFENDEARLLIESREEKDRVFIRIRDNGSGIDPQVMDKIFDPFFTTKDVGQGMGLGLSLCFRIMQEQEGHIAVKSEKGNWTEFTLDLPARA
jgi:signal transduction histidine kinase